MTAVEGGQQNLKPNIWEEVQVQFKRKNGFRIKLSAFQNKRINTVSYLSDSVSVKLLIKEKEEEEGILVWRGEGD